MKAKTPPIEIFISKEDIASFWFFVASLTLLGSAIYAERQAATKGLNPQFIGIGTSVTTAKIIPQGMEVDQQKIESTRLAMVRLVMDSIFNRSAIGLDAPDRCERLLTAEAWTDVMTKLVEPQKQAFEEGQMHQKVTLNSIKVYEEAENGEVTFEIEGQLIRTGIADREIFNQVWALMAYVTLEHNYSLRDCGRYPLVCSHIGVNEKPISSTQRSLTLEEEGSIRARIEAAEKKDGEPPAPADTKP